MTETLGKGMDVLSELAKNNALAFVLVAFLATNALVSWHASVTLGSMMAQFVTLQERSIQQSANTAISLLEQRETINKVVTSEVAQRASALSMLTEENENVQHMIETNEAKLDEILAYLRDLNR